VALKDCKLLDTRERGREELEKRVDELGRFKSYWDALYGQGLEVANWHKNGDLEPFDSFYESAEQERIAFL
jgi:hypothetical protein